MHLVNEVHERAWHPYANLCELVLEFALDLEELVFMDELKRAREELLVEPVAMSAAACR